MKKSEIRKLALKMAIEEHHCGFPDSDLPGFAMGDEWASSFWDQMKPVITHKKVQSLLKREGVEI